jgi:hypothetical protein
VRLVRHGCDARHLDVSGAQQPHRLHGRGARGDDVVDHDIHAGRQ